MSQTSSTCRPAGKPASRRILVSALLGSLVMSLAFAILANSAFGAGSIKVYSNSLETSDGRSEVRQVGSANCDRGGSSKSLRTELGKKTSECAYRVPFVGRDLVVGVKARLFKSTPKKIAKRTYVAVSLRQDGDGSRYQLAVFPVAGKFQLRKILPNGNIKYLDHGNKRNTINKLGEANRLTLRAYNGDGRLPAAAHPQFRDFDGPAGAQSRSGWRGSSRSLAACAACGRRRGAGRLGGAGGTSRLGARACAGCPARCSPGAPARSSGPETCAAPAKHSGACGHGSAARTQGRCTGSDCQGGGLAVAAGSRDGRHAVGCGCLRCRGEGGRSAGADGFGGGRR